MALYKWFVAAGLQARLSVKNTAGGEEIVLFCRFPGPSAASTVSSRSLHSRRRAGRRNRYKPATCSTGAQTEPVSNTPPIRQHCTAPPSTPVQPSSPTAPPPVKRTCKRRCELDLLRGTEDDPNRSLPISPPSLQPITSARPPTPRLPSPCSLMPPSPQPPWSPPDALLPELLATTPPHTASSLPGPKPPSSPSPDSLATGPQPSPSDIAPSELSNISTVPPSPDTPALGQLPLPSDSAPPELQQFEPAFLNIPVAPPFSAHLPSAPFKVICRLCF
jgi:hypothetical protein